MIKFLEINITNFLSMGEAYLNLDRAGFTQVSGINLREEDSTPNNGAGKTTLFEALVWCLTGETMRGTKDVVNRYAKGDCKVSVSFSFKGSQWNITRTMTLDREKGLDVYKDGSLFPSKGYRDSMAIFERELPEITYKFLTSVVVLGQGLPGRFTADTPSGRKATLEALTNADFMISQIKENIARRAGELENLTRENDDKMLVWETRVKSLDSQAEELGQKLNELRNTDTLALQAQLEVLAQEGSSINSELEKLAKEMEENSSKIEELDKKWGNLKSLQAGNLQEAQEYYLSKLKELELGEKRRLEPIEQSYESTLSLILKRKDESLAVVSDTTQLDQAKANLFELTQKIKESNELLEHNKAIVEGGYCRLCKRKLDDVPLDELVKAQDKVKALGEEISTLVETKTNLETKISEMTRAKSLAQAEIESQYSNEIEKTKALRAQQIDELNTEFSQKTEKLEEGYKKLQEQVISQYKDQVEEVEKELSGKRLKSKTLLDVERDRREFLAGKREEYRTIKATLDAYELQYKQTEKKLEDCQKEIGGLKALVMAAEEKREELKNRQAIVSQMSTFASRDFRGILLEDLIHRLNDILGDFAEVVYGNRLTRFYQQGNELRVEFDGKEYESLSGGEQQKLNVLVQLSLRELIIELSGNSGSLLVVDEVFDGLDYVGCEKMINLFQTLNIPIYLITHHKDLSIPCDQEITVVKGPEGIATLELTV